MNFLPQARNKNVVVQYLENEVLLYDLITNKAFCLNQTSALVYQLSDGTRTILEISDLMSKELKTLVSKDIVRLALDGLRKDKLLENGDDLTDHLAGLTRREVIKRAGLATMVALPIVSSVVAPTSAMAASECANSGGLQNDQGTCPGFQRCVNGMCNACLPRGTAPTTGVCGVAVYAAVECCSGICFIPTNTCT